MSLLYGVPLTGAYHVVTWISAILTPALGALAAVAAIVIFTGLVRLLIMPLSYRAMRGQAAQARLAPQVQELRRRHRKNPERMQRELGELYRREGISMLAGIGPLLAQAPFLSVVYLLFRSSQVAGHPNELLTRSLLRVPLGMHWLGGAGPVSPQGLVFLGVFATLAGIGLLSARLATRGTGSPAGGPAGPAAGSGWLPWVLPLVTVAFAAFSPLATGVYLTATTAWTLLERRVLLRRALHGDAAPVPAAPAGRVRSLCGGQASVRHPVGLLGFGCGLPGAAARLGATSGRKAPPDGAFRPEPRCRPAIHPGLASGHGLTKILHGKSATRGCSSGD